MPRRTPPGVGRELSQRLKTARGRTPSSQRWLRRQLADPFVHAAKRAGYRSRAAWKLAELDDRFGLLKPGARVVDLGAAPGGWTQLAVERCPGGAVLAVDISPMKPVPGARILQLDFLASGADETVRQALGGPVDAVLSDMAAPATGHKQTDHLRIIALAEAALDFAVRVLKPGGAFVAKVLKGGTEGVLLARMKRDFAQVRHAKPAASRKESAESYVVATGFRAGGER
jgi:23S rRNA (uridine2552-2'-O)-methyltransferase